jgi:hypothetical protein
MGQRQINRKAEGKTSAFFIVFIEAPFLPRSRRSSISISALAICRGSMNSGPVGFWLQPSPWLRRKGRFGSVKVLKPAPSPKPRQKPQIPAHRHIFSINALVIQGLSNPGTKKPFRIAQPFGLSARRS